MKFFTWAIFMGLAAAVLAQCPLGGVVRYQMVDYPVVSIGGQCWFAQNLAATAFSNGDELQVVDGMGLWNAGWPAQSDKVVRAGTPRRKAANIALHGMYYNGHVVLDARGICPNGWHVPTHEEWIQLEIALGCGAEIARTFGFRGANQGLQLRKSAPEFEEWNGADPLGWGALPSGFRTADGDDMNFGDSAYFWSSSPRSSRSLYVRGLTYHRNDVYSSEKDLAEGCSIRCLLDQ